MRKPVHRFLPVNTRITAVTCLLRDLTRSWCLVKPVTVLAVDVGPNPDCPGKKSDMAKATGPDGAQP